MKVLDLNDFSAEAKESIKAVFGLLAGSDQEVHVYEGEQALYTIFKADDHQTPPDQRPTSVPSDAIPADPADQIHGEAPLHEAPSKVSHG